MAFATALNGEGFMAEMRCSISLVINGGRWLQEGEALVAQGDVPRLWSLAGLQDYVRLSIGGRLGHTLEQTAIVEQRWCRAKPGAADGEAVAAAAAVVTAPHVTADDTGAGLALEAVEAAALVKCDVMVTVGSQITWQPLRQKLEAAGVQLVELLLPASGKVVVSTERVIDLRELVKRQHGNSPVSAMFKTVAAPAVNAPAATRNTVEHDDSFAANAILGTVKALAKGYGTVTRKDGRGEVQFLAGHVSPPGFEFIEVGDTVRFDVVKVSSGKWQAQRVVRS